MVFLSLVQDTVIATTNSSSGFSNTLERDLTLVLLELWSFHADKMQGNGTKQNQPKAAKHRVPYMLSRIPNIQCLKLLPTLFVIALSGSLPEATAQ
jgi:hypothetical protein